MTNLTWIANGTGFWSDGTNWSPGQVPLAADTVLFDGTGTGASFVSGSTISGLTITSPSALLTALGSVQVTGTTTLNAGTLSIGNTGSVSLNNLTNQGTITLASTGYLALTGSYATGDLAHIAGTGGTVDLQGTLINSGSTFSRPANVVHMGDVIGGTIINGGSLDQVTLDGVTWLGPFVDLIGTLTIRNGITVRTADDTGPGTLRFNFDAQLNFLGDQVVNAGTIIEKGPDFRAGFEIFTDANLTLGAGVDLQLIADPLTSQPTASLTFSGIGSAGTILNQGTIETKLQPGYIAEVGNGLTKVIAVGARGVINVPLFQNEGTILAHATDFNNVRFTVTSTDFVNKAGGIIVVTKDQRSVTSEFAIGPRTTFGNDGSMLASRGTITVAPGVHGTGQVTVRDDGLLHLQQDVAAGQTIGLNVTGTVSIDQPLLFGGTIIGLTQGTELLLGTAATPVSYSSGKLVMQMGGGQTFTLAVAGNLTLSDFIVNTGTGSTTITTDLPAPCFAAGTLIATPEGERAVEHLRVGDLCLIAGTSERRPIVWIGRRRVDCRRHPDPSAVHPVRIARDAFGPGQPSRDLFLSPDHAIFADGVLIPVKYLINGNTIAQVHADSVTYFHIELDRHDIVMAEGLAVESYLDTGDRDCFGDDPNAIRLFPVFGAGARASRIHEAKGRTPLAIGGPVVERLRRRLGRGGGRHAA